jgi:hypothetical protein
MYWTKRSQLTRLLAYFCIISFVVVLSKRYFMLRASLEQTVVELNIRNMRILFSSFKELEQYKAPSMLQSFIERFELRPFRLINTSESLNPGEWGFNAKTRRLSYRVENVSYFTSPSKSPYIHISFAKAGGSAVIDISRHQWCRQKRWWGCERW